MTFNYVLIKFLFSLSFSLQQIGRLIVNTLIVMKRVENEMKIFFDLEQGQPREKRIRERNGIYRVELYQSQVKDGKLSIKHSRAKLLARQVVGKQPDEQKTFEE